MTNIEQAANDPRAVVDRAYSDDFAVERYLRDAAAPLTDADVEELNAIEPLSLSDARST